jgi:hypothetical protein
MVHCVYAPPPEPCPNVKAAIEELKNIMSTFSRPMNTVSQVADVLSSIRYFTVLAQLELNKT